MEKNKKKIGLVIQGPLFSISEVDYYNCRENIRRIIAEFGYLFDQVVISTWDREVGPNDNWCGAKLIFSPNDLEESNKHQQFVNILNGLEEFEKKGIDYVIVTRTDIYLDLEKLIESFFKTHNKTKNRNLIGTSMVYPETFLLHDFYFMAELERLRSLCMANLAYDRFEFTPSIHQEMVLKHAYAEYKDEIGVDDPAYFPFHPPLGVSLETKKIFDYMFDNVYFSLDPEIFQQAMWRDVYPVADHIAALTAPVLRSIKYNLPLHVSIDWKRYFNFRSQLSPERITPRDKWKIRAGKSGWYLWNLGRKLKQSVLR